MFKLLMRSQLFILTFVYLFLPSQTRTGVLCGALCWLPALSTPRAAPLMELQQPQNPQQDLAGGALALPVSLRVLAAQVSTGELPQPGAGWAQRCSCSCK